jgi:gluconokinase
MGVSGSGKSTIGALLSERLSWTFAEGDDFHPSENVEKMSKGIPLSDADRWPWLESITEVMDRWHQESIAGIITCSALRRSYREMLAKGRPYLRFVYLKGSQDLISQQLIRRHDHFMPPNLLESQFATFEDPEPNERILICSIGDQVEDVVTNIIMKLHLA